MTILPCLAKAMPPPAVFPSIRVPARARGPVLLLWQGRSQPCFGYMQAGGAAHAQLEIGFNAAFIALLSWWIAAGPMFQAKATDDGARGAIALVILLIAIDLIVRIRRRRTLLRAPHPAA